MFEKVKSLSESFFRLMGVAIDELIITEENGEKSIFNITLKTPDSKLLIGIHGQTLEVIKQLLCRMIERSLATQITLHLEINDYIKSREEKLFRYIDSRIDYAVEQQREIILPTMTSYERKKAHSHIAERNIP
jgi:predicted RNA-binding protein Jag